jgi:hypothetical protein
VGCSSTPGPHVRVRRVRAADDPPGRRLVLGTEGRPQRQPANYHKLHGSAVPRLLLDRRRRAVGQRRSARQKSAANVLGRCGRSGPADPTATDLRDPGQPVHPQGQDDPRVGDATTSSCASRRPTARGRTRSRRTSGRCASSCSPTATTPTTPPSAARSAPTCAGATPTPETPSSSKPNDDTEPASAANNNADGATPNAAPHNARTFVVRALAKE